MGHQHGLGVNPEPLVVAGVILRSHGTSLGEEHQDITHYNVNGMRGQDHHTMLGNSRRSKGLDDVSSRGVPGMSAITHRFGGADHCTKGARSSHLRGQATCMGEW